MFNYNICSEPDEALFVEQCKSLEKHIPGIIKESLLHDVDDSKTQVYSLSNKKILVHNSYYVGAVYIESDVKLESYFK